MLGAVIFFAVAAIAQMPDVTYVMASAFGAVLAAATLVARQMNAPGEDHGRPAADRIDDGTGVVDAVRFRGRTSTLWAYAVALALWDVLAIVVVVRLARAGFGEVVRSPVTWGPCCSRC